MAEFRGIFPAIITPMTPDGTVNEVALREILEFNIRAGVHGFWIAGGTGESILLDDEENMRIAEIAADQNGGRVKNIMHVGAATTRRAEKLAEHAARVGVEAVCAVPPFFYMTTDYGVAEYYSAVGEAAGLPLFVYNLPRATGVEITPELMLKIQDKTPQLTGLKHSAPNIMEVRAFANMGLSCLIGNGTLMLQALTMGATGCVDGLPAWAPQIWVEILEAYHAGDLARAEAAQERGARLYDLIFDFGEQNYLAIVKVVMSEILGIDCGHPRLPGLPLTNEQQTRVLQRAAELELTRVVVGTGD